MFTPLSISRRHTPDRAKSQPGRAAGRPAGVGRWALAALLGCVVLLVGAPTALAATGEISGTVIEAGSKAHLKNIEVSVYEATEKESFVGFATTETDGDYAVENLPEGSYKVEFSGGFEGLNYVTQYYNDKSSFVTAESVKVVIGEPAKSENIDAEMEAGGEVEGTVIDASTHKALPNVLVAALGPGEVPDGYAVTNASGQYTMSQLAAGSYAIGFAASGYVIQYYNDQLSFASANLVSVVKKSITTGINAALMPKAPINTGAPVASGTPAVGQTLSCSNGSWTGTPAPTFTYSWLRDGVPITGATAATYVIQAADQGNGLTCKVTATNKSGTVSAVSNTLIVPVPTPPPPTPVLTLAGAKVVVSGGSARVPITCESATCAGTIELTEQVAVKHRHGRKTTSTKKTVILGAGAYSLAAGHSATIVVPLTSTGRHALASAKHHRLSARASASVIGGATASRSIVLSQAPPAKHRHKHR
jgi:Carboxypeptidase regulatory-like domain